MIASRVTSRAPATVALALLLLAVPATASDGDLRPWVRHENDDQDHSAPVAPSRLVTSAEVAGPTVEPVIYGGAHTCTTCSIAGCKCDAKKQAALKAAVAGAHKGVFYENDFLYACDDCYVGHQIGDALKRNCLGRYITYDMGGQFRTRLHVEENMRGLGLTGVSDDFLLYRTRLYTNVEFGSWFRFYAEYIDAVSNFEQFGPRPIEENRADMLNLFGDFVLFDYGKKLTARVGRQELLYGAQRTVSPLDWANTRRTFDGYKMMYSGDKWDIDAFAVRPLQTDFRRFDPPIDEIGFYGVYSTYKGCPCGDTLDLYWLAIDENIVSFYYDSMGARYAGSRRHWLFEAEANYQFGSNANGSSHDAAAFTFGLGREMQRPCKPTLWAYIDWASGSAAQGAGNGYFHFFPLAHKYNGFMDLYGRRNLIDANLLLTTQVSPKAKFLLWFHAFWLEDDRDTPYSVVMTPYAPGVTPIDSELGQELDLLLDFNLAPRHSLLFGYSYFWAGDYYNSPGLPTTATYANFFYTQYQFNF